VFSSIRRRATYANVVATLALFLALGGGAAMAAKHYLITSKKQIAPSVLHSLKGKPGKAGPAGAAGAAGAPGAPGSARAYANVVVNGAGNPVLEDAFGLSVASEPAPSTFCIGPLIAGHTMVISPIGVEAVFAQVSPQQCPGNYEIKSNQAITGGEGFSVAVP
jgi:hypothetical protein